MLGANLVDLDSGLYFAAGRTPASAATAAVRMAAMALDPPLAVLALLQLSHGVTIGAMSLGVVHFINEAVPDRLNANAQGLIVGFMAASMNALGLVLSGPLYAATGALAYLAMSGLALLSLGAAAFVLKSWDRSRLLG